MAQSLSRECLLAEDTMRGMSPQVVTALVNSLFTTVPERNRAIEAFQGASGDHRFELFRVMQRQQQLRAAADPARLTNDALLTLLPNAAQVRTAFAAIPVLPGAIPPPALPNPPLSRLFGDYARELVALRGTPARVADPDRGITAAPEVVGTARALMESIHRYSASLDTDRRNLGLGANQRAIARDRQVLTLGPLADSAHLAYFTNIVGNSRDPRLRATLQRLRGYLPPAP